MHKTRCEVICTRLHFAYNRGCVCMYIKAALSHCVAQATLVKLSMLECTCLVVLDARSFVLSLDILFSFR